MLTYASKNDLCEGIEEVYDVELYQYDYEQSMVKIFIRDEDKSTDINGTIFYKMHSSTTSSLIPSASQLERLFHVVYLEKAEFPDTYMIKNSEQLKDIEKYLRPISKTVAEVPFSASRNLPPSFAWRICEKMFNIHSASGAFATFSREDIVLIDGEPFIKNSVGIFRTSEVKHFKKNFVQLSMILENSVEQFCLTKDEKELFLDFIIVMTSNVELKSLKKLLEKHPLVQTIQHVGECIVQLTCVLDTLKNVKRTQMSILHKHIIYFHEVVLRSRCREMDQWRDKIEEESRKILDNITKEFVGDKNYVEPVWSNITTLIITTRNIVRYYSVLKNLIYYSIIISLICFRWFITTMP